MVVGRKPGTLVARRLKEARTAVGLSQRELGVRAGMDPSVASPRINQYERGKHLPDPLTLERLGQVLNYPLPFFYAAEDLIADQIRAFHLASADEKKKMAAIARRVLSRNHKFSFGQK